MKRKYLTLGISAFVIVISLLIFSCKKHNNQTSNTTTNNTSTDSETSGASDNIYAENVSNDITNIGDQAGGTSSGKTLSTYKVDGDNSFFLLSCVDSIRRDSVSSPKVITVYFNGNNVCQDGRTRSGQLKFSYTGGLHYRDSGVVITVTPVAYTVDGNQISGTKTITNKGRINGNFQWQIVSSLTIVKANNGGTITWNCNKTKELLNTGAVYTAPNWPINWKAAKIGITGNASGTTASGETYTATVTSQLVKDFTCAPSLVYPHRHPFIQGSFDFTPGTKATRHVDYGNGSCDLNATVTINGISYPITLP